MSATPAENPILEAVKRRLGALEGLERRDPDKTHVRSYADPMSPMGLALQRKGYWRAYLKCQFDPLADSRFSRLSPQPWTIGRGLTGMDIGPRTVWTLDYEDERFTARAQQEIAGVVADVKAALPDHQVVALVLLRYNIGAQAFRGSTLLKKLNAGDAAGAAAQFERWNRSAGQVSPALKTRRAEEKAIFLGEIAP